MRIYQNLFLILSIIIGYNICLGKELSVTEILYLPTDRSATEARILDSNEDICALVKMPFPKVDETVISGDQIFKKEYHGNEWYIYMPPNTYKFFIKLSGYEALEIDLSQKFPNGVESGKTYKVIVPYDKLRINQADSETIHDASLILDNSKLDTGFNNFTLTTPANFQLNKNKKIFFKRNELYAHASYSFLGLSGLEIGIGGYISNFNLEINYIFGASKSEDIFWNNPLEDSMPIKATYSPTEVNMKLGYGIQLMDRIRLTPRLGIQYICLKEKSTSTIANNANTLGIPINFKFNFAIIKHFGVVIDLLYNISINKSDGYKILSNISNRITGYSSGFRLNIGIYCNF